MDRTIKPLKDDTAEPEAVETPKPVSPLSDFLAGGLRESQRPTAPGRESQRPSGMVRTSQPPSNTPREDEAPVHSPAETVELPAAAHEQAGVAAGDESPAAAAVDVASAGLAEAPVTDIPSEEPIVEEPPHLDEDAEVAPIGVAQSESDYVVPVPILSRPRIVAAAVTVALLILVSSLLLTRETNVPPRADIPPATPAAAAHEPLPPAPPLEEPEEQIPDTEEEATPGERKVSGAPAAAESSSVSPPFGPNVARYPDLPTPVLIQLEKDQEEKATTKAK